MFRGTRGWLLLVVLGTLGHVNARAQIDPEKRRLIQVGYNQPIQGRAPIAAYGFYYHNQPQFYATNLTLRLSVAPIYLDSELGFSHFLGPNTDLALGLAGGGFADSYGEIREGVFRRKESFPGDGAEVSASVFHLLNPAQTIPLYLVVRGSVHQSFYRRDSDTADEFELPDDRATFQIRTGLRFGGEEPSMTEPVAMELSLWHEARIRGEDGKYGFDGDRKVESQSQLLWGRALLRYALDKSEHMIKASLTSGTAWEADRFSAYRLGGLLPFSSEFPLSIPGYYFQEISAKTFALVNAQYSFPLPAAKNWRFDILGATGWVDYAPGLRQAGDWHSGVGGGMTYISTSGSWLVSLLYGHGIDAIRSHGRGADQVAFLFQYRFRGEGPGQVPLLRAWNEPIPITRCGEDLSLARPPEFRRLSRPDDAPISSCVVSLW